MKKLLGIFALCTVAVGCTQSHVVNDNSVAAQFARLDGVNGAHVTVGNTSAQVQTQTTPPLPAGVSSNGRNIPVANPFANAVWSTNLKVNAPPSTGTVNPPVITSSHGPVVGFPASGNSAGISSVSAPGSNVPNFDVNSNAASISPTTNTPGMNLTPGNLQILPKTGP